MSEKQADLSGAYYGPAIPPPAPPRRSSHGHGRGSGCGCCWCLLKVIITIILILGLATFILWLIFRPSKVKFHVTDASLTEFNLTDSNMLYYNLSLDITIRNPSKRMGIYYDSIEARAFYGEQRFRSIYLPSFYQRHKNTTVLNPVFEGQQVMLLSSGGKSVYDQEKSDGVYSVAVKLYLKLRFKYAFLIKTDDIKPRVECDLKVPFKGSNGGLARSFETTKCKLIDFKYL